MFDCQRCGKCCTDFKYLNVTKKDLKRISRYLGVKSRTLRRKLELIKDGRNYLMPLPCKFLKDNECLIHEVRPWNCVAYPMHAIASNPEYLKRDISCPELIRIIEEIREGLKEK